MIEEKKEFIIKQESGDLEVGIANGYVYIYESQMCCSAGLEVDKIDELISILTRLKNGN